MKITWNDLSGDKIQIIRRKSDSSVYYVSYFSRTIFHNHPYVALIRLKGLFLDDFEVIKIMATDFDLEEWEEIYLKSKWDEKEELNEKKKRK